MPKFKILNGALVPDRDGVRVITDTNTRTERVEPTTERDNPPHHKRRDSIKDSVLALLIVAIAVSAIGSIAALLDLIDWLTFIISLIALAASAAIWPMLAEFMSRDDARHQGHALKDISHHRRFTEESLALDQANHKRDLHDILRQIETAEAERRYAQRASNVSADDDMDLQHFQDSIIRGVPIGRRNWVGKKLPSGLMMTAPMWQAFTKRLEADGVIVLAGQGMGYRLTLEEEQQPAPGLDDGRIPAQWGEEDGPICSLDS